MHFYTREPHFLKSGTKLLHLILKSMNLNKVAILFFAKTWLCFCTEVNIKKSG